MRSPLICCLLVLLMSSAANAATYPVTSTADTMATGTLRWAIDSANTNPGRDTITFALATTTIAPTGALPYLSDPSEAGTLIDGTTQTGYSGTPLVRLAGASAGDARGLFMNRSSNLVKALIITRFSQAGIDVGGGVDNAVIGCYVVSNGAEGINIWGGRRTQIGGVVAGAGNVISSNGSYGIDLSPGTSDNIVEGNFIGVNPSGASAAGNGSGGVLVMSPSNRIGGAVPGGRNVISGHSSSGIRLANVGAYHNVIEGNFCGVNASGSAAIPNETGISLWNASNNTIRANVCSGNSGRGISFESGCHDNTAAGNLIGTDATGAFGVSNRYDGVIIGTDCGGTQIGGTNAADRNIISGNGQNGIYLLSNTNVTICGNVIGILTNGTPLENGWQGIRMQFCRRVTVGGTNANARNVIAGNRNTGLEMYACVSNTIGHNYIGVNEMGAAVSNHQQGVLAQSGGGHAFFYNVISGNGTWGLELQAATNCTVRQNLFGTDPSGASACGNGNAGIFLNAGAAHNQIGGRWLDEGNVFSGNNLYGVRVQDATTVSNVFKGNRVGTDGSGFLAVPNDEGFWIYNAPFNTIGSTNADERNVISGNSIVGIDIMGTNSHHNLVIGNYIGVDATGVNELPNTSGGVYFYDASSNQVGGVGTGSVNRIACNGGSGIQVATGDSVGNLLVNNSIFHNGVLGIDLELGTPTSNDSGDSDGGPNRQQNFPVLISVSNNGSQIRVVWTLDSVSNQPFIIEFYGSRGPGRLGRGDGEYSLGSVGPLVMPASGLLGGTNLLTTPNPPPNFISALAHHADLHDTSEFSQRIMLDSDNDGMGDGYETTYFGGYTSGNPNDHLDGDPFSSLEEFWADTNPYDFASHLFIHSVGTSGNYAQVTAPCSRDRSYQLLVCTNLNAAPQVWAVRNSTFTYEGADGRFIVHTTNREMFRIRASIP